MEETPKENPSRFKTGNPGGPGRKKGGKNRRTVLREMVGKSQWPILKGYLENEGIEKLIREMGKMKGRDYVNAWYHLAEYIKPKLVRDTTPKDREGDTNIQNNVYLSLPIEDQARLVELMTKVEKLGQGLTLDTPTPEAPPQEDSSAITDLPYEETATPAETETPGEADPPTTTT